MFSMDLEVGQQHLPIIMFFKPEKYRWEFRVLLWRVQEIIGICLVKILLTSWRASGWRTACQVLCYEHMSKELMILMMHHIFYSVSIYRRPCPNNELVENTPPDRPIEIHFREGVLLSLAASWGAHLFIKAHLGREHWQDVRKLGT